MIDRTNLIVIDRILDDTGSEKLETFEVDNCTALGLKKSYDQWLSASEIEASNGSVVRERYELEIQLLVDGVPFGPVTRAVAFVTHVPVTVSNTYCPESLLAQ